MSERTGHFMPDHLLASQFAALEDPRTEGNVVTVSVDADIPSICRSVVLALHTQGFWPAR